ncbi:MAG: double zinc ribbon domain-containing protein [Candidatus Rokuibacteriota bacterium]
MQCPRCQHANLPQAKFCLECGVRFGVAGAQCSTPLPAGAILSTPTNADSLTALGCRTTLLPPA